ncbi:MAG: histidinol-phosphate transaminase [Chloroflexota bacterium]|nr:histidinol-phosphate transaminase [Chloroflexota bacterium]
MDVKGLVRPELITMAGYTPIEPLETLSQYAELPSGRGVKLDANENPYGCSPRVYQALADYSRYHIYPDPEQRMLRQALENYTGLSQQYIICGSGSDELIDLILRLFVEPGDEVINCPPTFGMYPFNTEICGGEVVNIPRNEDFTIDMGNIEGALNKKTKAIFVASPNNPTGNLITEQEIAELLDTEKIVVLDEAYFEFSNVTMANLVSHHPNLIVLRTFSKWAGLAGLRMGYGVFPVEIATYLMKIKQPYNINAAAQVAALASLADIDYLSSNIAKIVAERERLFMRLKEFDWLQPYPSQGNFILCSVIDGDAKEVWSQLQKKGIFVRYFDSPQLKNYLRITAGKPEDTDALIEALKGVKND